MRTRRTSTFAEQQWTIQSEFITLCMIRMFIPVVDPNVVCQSVSQLVSQSVSIVETELQNDIVTE